MWKNTLLLITKPSNINTTLNDIAKIRDKFKKEQAFNPLVCNTFRLKKRNWIDN